MRILVCGGRKYADKEKVNEVLSQHRPSLIIEGGALGADRLARQWAYANNTTVQTFLAEWDKYNKSAGPIRNQQMLDEGKPDCIIAFPGGKGTADMVARARKAGIRVYQISS